MSKTPNSARSRGAGTIGENEQVIRVTREDVYKERCKVAKRKCEELEEQNDKLALNMKRAKRLIARLRLERSFLFDKLEKYEAADKAAVSAPVKEERSMVHDGPSSTLRGHNASQQHQDSNPAEDFSLHDLAFQRFYDERLPHTMQQHPEMSDKEARAELSREWQNLPQALREDFYWRARMEPKNDK